MDYTGILGKGCTHDRLTKERQEGMVQSLSRCPRFKEGSESKAFSVLSDHTKPYEVHIDASDYAIGGVLMQELHPIAYENRKLNETKKRYTTQEKEMTFVVHCF